MSMGVNKVIVIGNLGQDPDVRATKSGTDVVTMSVAVNEQRKKGDEWVDFVEWVRVVAFGRTAKAVGEYLRKGSKLYAEGRLSTTDYVDKDGVKRWKTEVIADTVLFLDAKDSRGDRGSAESSTKTSKPPPKKDDFISDDDLPF